MSVCRDAGYTFYPEVKWCEGVASLAHEDDQKSAQTGIHMQRQVVAHSQLQNRSPSFKYGTNYIHRKTILRN